MYMTPHDVPPTHGDTYEPDLEEQYIDSPPTSESVKVEDNDMYAVGEEFLEVCNQTSYSVVTKVNDSLLF